MALFVVRRVAPEGPAAGAEIRLGDRVPGRDWTLSCLVGCGYVKNGIPDRIPIDRRFLV